MANEPASMRTPLGRVRYLGSARSGTTHDWHMRLTAIALVPLTIAFVWLILSLVGKDYNAVRSELGQPVPGDADAALPRSPGSITGKLGMQTIIEDYVHGEPARDVVAHRQSCSLRSASDSPASTPCCASASFRQHPGPAARVFERHRHGRTSWLSGRRQSACL